MKYIKLCMMLLIFMISISIAKAQSPKIIWTAVFSNIEPLNPSVSKHYCQTHTPSVIVTTIKKITSKQGVTSLNDINIRYLSYKTIEKNHLYFNIVNAIIRGKDKNNHPWLEKMKLYEQTLAPVAVTYTVWSTTKCKGIFLGTPNRIKN